MNKLLRKIHGLKKQHETSLIYYTFLGCRHLVNDSPVVGLSFHKKSHRLIGFLAVSLSWFRTHDFDRLTNRN